jgi:hypothetical protein
MNEKIILVLMGVLVALGGWNLNQTFSLSKDMVLLKEKVRHHANCITMVACRKFTLGYFFSENI